MLASKSASAQELKVILRNDLSSFIQKAYYCLYGDDYVHNWHVDYLASILEKVANGESKRVIINLPPRSLKSLCASVAFTAWLLGRDPRKKIITVSYADELSTRLAFETRNLMCSDFYRKLFPQTILTKNTSEELITTKGGCRYATSIAGTLTGRGADIIIIDDPLKPEEAISDTARNKVNEWFGRTLISRLNNKENGAVIIIMQRLHVDDLVGYLTEKGGDEWLVINLPAIAKEDEEYVIESKLYPKRIIKRKQGEALHPEFESLETLQKIKDNMGSYNFQSQYLQEPIPEDGGMVKLKWFPRYDSLPPEKPIRIVQSLDTASKSGELNDYTVCTTWHQHKDGYYLVDVHRSRMDFPELKKKVISLADIHKPNVILVEDKGSGTQLIQQLKMDTRLPIIPINPTQDKKTRMFGQTGIIEAGKVFIPREKHWLCDFEIEMSRFPQSKHDDQVDSVSQALEYMTKKGVIPRVVAVAVK